MWSTPVPDIQYDMWYERGAVNEDEVVSLADSRFHLVAQAKSETKR